jgi:hypothetical protein
VWHGECEFLLLRRVGATTTVVVVDDTFRARPSVWPSERRPWDAVGMVVMVLMMVVVMVVVVARWMVDSSFRCDDSILYRK